MIPGVSAMKASSRSILALGVLIVGCLGLRFSNCAHAAEFLVVSQKEPACDLMVLGAIEPSDDIKCIAQLGSLLRHGCTSPRIYLYSPGGHLPTAMKIGEQIYFLQLTTVGPMLQASQPREGTDNRRREREFVNSSPVVQLGRHASTPLLLSLKSAH
jgi:hypothetical protein